MKLTLYHGTTDVYLENILKEGLKEPYLTDSLDLAEYYSRVAVEELEGEDIVLEVLVDSKLLRLDDNSMSEPVRFDDYSSYELEEIVQCKYDELSKKYPEWVNEKLGTISIPKEYYQASLDTVSTCWFEGIVNPKDIKVLRLINV